MKARRQYSLMEDLTAAVKLILIVFWFTTPIWILILSSLPPKFSLQVVGTTPTDLEADTPPTLVPITISTVFNMTLHATNRRLMERCYSNGEAAVRYSGHIVAWGRTMAFCVGAKEARDMPLVAWADGVSLPPALRERMAADWRLTDGEGAVELGEDATFTPCITFALENWASDISDHLLGLKSLVS